MNILVAAIAGIVFGAGLALSGMSDPAKVLNFLDVAGTWDPTLAFVMGGALCVTTPGFYLVQRRARPLFDTDFHLPTRTDIDGRLLGGAALFGLGWGIAGLCPGPALADLASGMPVILAFVAAMIGGALLHDRTLGAG
jgi:hypothetical protein